MNQSIQIVAENEQNFKLDWTFDLVRRMVEVEKLASVQQVLPILEKMIVPQAEELTFIQMVKLIKIVCNKDFNEAGEEDESKQRKVQFLDAIATEFSSRVISDK